MAAAWALAQICRVESEEREDSRGNDQVCRERSGKEG
jgi:hypothetical protein